jgi:hypothetical protein
MAGREIRNARPISEAVARLTWLSNEIFPEKGRVEPAGISGVVGEPTGAIWAGRFGRGLNPVYVTTEAVLEELLPAPEEDWRTPF